MNSHNFIECCEEPGKSLNFVHGSKQSAYGFRAPTTVTNMGLFNRLFGPKQEAPPARVREAISALENYVRSIMSHYGEAHFQGDTMDKQMLSVYLFGGISALAMQNQMSQPQAHAIALTLLIDVFEYDPQDSAAKAQALISAAPDKTSHLYKIIHRGLDSFLHWRKNSDDGAAKDFADIMAQCRKLSS